MILAVAGNPVGHSKSPLIFNTHFRITGMDAAYTAFAADSAEEIAAALRELQMRGMNVTAPFKDAVIPYCDSVSSRAQSLQSVNTLLLENDQVRGYSTDGYGVRRSLEAAIGSLQGKEALLIGAGGAGRMAAEALYTCGLPFTILNRTYEKARVLAEHFGASAVAVSEVAEVCSCADIVINTLPAGKELFPGTLLQEGSVLLDAVYTRNRFREEAQAKGVRIIPGESWLLYQAHGAAEHFLGHALDKQITPSMLTTYTRSIPNIIALTGFMGSGKTSVAAELSQISGWPVIDLDQEIEQREKCSIENIFKMKGEPYFRTLETSLLTEIAGKSERVIVSCGGGIISHAENNDILREKTYTVWLYAPLHESFQRIHDTGRPLARNGFQQFQALFDARKLRYAFSSDLLVRNYGKTPEECARRIYDEISLLISH